MTAEPGREIHVRNGAVSPEALAAAFAALGIDGAVIEEVPGEGREVELHTRVGPLVSHLTHSTNEGVAAVFKRFNETLWAHIQDPGVRLLVVDTQSDITAILAPDLPDAAYDALAAFNLASVEKFGIIAYDAHRNAWVQVDRRR